MAVRYKVVPVRNLGILGKICRLASCGGQLKNSPFHAQVAQLGESTEFISWKMRRFKSYLVRHQENGETLPPVMSIYKARVYCMCLI